MLRVMCTLKCIVVTRGSVLLPCISADFNVSLPFVKFLLHRNGKLQRPNTQRSSYPQIKGNMLLVLCKYISIVIWNNTGRSVRLIRASCKATSRLTIKTNRRSGEQTRQHAPDWKAILASPVRYISICLQQLLLSARPWTCSYRELLICCFTLKSWRGESQSVL